MTCDLLLSAGAQDWIAAELKRHAVQQSHTVSRNNNRQDGGFEKHWKHYVRIYALWVNAWNLHFKTTSKKQQLCLNWWISRKQVQVRYIYFIFFTDKKQNKIEYNFNAYTINKNV